MAWSVSSELESLEVLEVVVSLLLVLLSLGSGGPALGGASRSRGKVLFADGMWWPVSAVGAPGGCAASCGSCGVACGGSRHRSASVAVAEAPRSPR